jgi:hypothetical protein
MKRIVLTSAVTGVLTQGKQPEPPWDEMMELTCPRMRKFAKLHGYDFKCHQKSLSKRTPQWDKLRAILQAYNEGYQQVLWIDLDVFIQDIRKDVPLPDSCWQSLVMAEWAETGVWKTSLMMRPFIEKAWDMHDTLKARGLAFHEQAAIMLLMGHRFLGKNRVLHIEPNELTERTHFLDPRFNILVRQASHYNMAWMLHAAGCPRHHKIRFLKNKSKVIF